MANTDEIVLAAALEYGRLMEIEADIGIKVDVHMKDGSLTPRLTNDGIQASKDCSEALLRLEKILNLVRRLEELA